MSKVSPAGIFNPAVLASFLVCLFAGCASAPRSSPESAGSGAAVSLSGKTDGGSGGSVSPSSVSGGAGTVLAVPPKDALKKNSLDATVLGYLEKGSPDSLTLAVDRIGADSRGMTDQNRVALALAGELMKILYPLETVSWSIPSVPEEDPWIAALRSARLGVYDYSAGSADFLSLVLPSLVLAVTTVPGEYYADAEAALQKSSSINSRSVLPPLLLALLAERRKDPETADAWYRKAWELDSSCYPAGVGHARALIRVAENPRPGAAAPAAAAAEALSIARTLAARYPASLAMTELCAEASFALGDWAAADPYVLAVLKAEPDNTLFLLMRARILVERKDFLKASYLLEAFATTNRSDKNYLLLRARVVREWNRNPASAVAYLEEAQRLYPEDDQVLLACAEVCYQTGGRVNGLGGRDFTSKVLAKDPVNRIALSLIVGDYIRTGDWTSAVSGADRLVSLYPSEESRLLLLRSCLGAGQAARAVSVGRSLYSASSPSDETIGLYLQALIATGDSRTASSVIASRMQGAPSSLKSLLYYYQSRIATDADERLSALRSSLLADPRNEESLFSMYEWYFARNDYRKAQYYLKQVIALDPSNRNYAQLLSALEDLLAR